MSGIVVIGAGACGAQAALAARDAGHVGPIILIGDEPGTPYERPPLSKPSADGVLRRPIASSETFLERSIALIDGVSATRFDRKAQVVTLADGRTVPYDRLLLATGARPRRLGCPGGENALVFRTIEDAQAMFARAGGAGRVVIVGAGLIGLELAAVLAQRGLTVTVLEAGPRPLGRNVPRPFAKRLAERHRGHGVTILCDVTVSACANDGVTLSDGRFLGADIIIAAIGVEPAIELARAEGLATENGICVGASLATEDPAIFAAGDCAAVRMPNGVHQRFETWQNAQVQGDVAGRNLAGGHEAFTGPVSFWSDQYDLGLHCVGDTSSTPAAVRALGEEAEVLYFLDTCGRLVGAAGLGPHNAAAKDIRLAQRLIGMGAGCTPAELADPAINLKRLLRQA